MILGEPGPTQYDLHFRLFGFPVRVHPYFWVVTLLLGMGGFRSQQAEPVKVLIWVVVVFVSILVHELGHAFMQRYYGGHPWITLYSFGGLASCDDCDRSPRSQIAILLAGPGAGFLLAAIVVMVMRLSGHLVGFTTNIESIDPNTLDVESLLEQPMGPLLAYFEPVVSQPLNDVIGNLLQINILWGLLNLLPVYPLDGGQIARELFTLGHPRKGIVLSLQLSIATAAALVVYGLFREAYFMALMFGLLGYGSYKALTAYREYL